MTLTADPPAAETAPPSGPAIYFDGTCSTRNDVLVEAGAAGLQIFSAGRHLLDEWLYAELRRQAAPDGVLRLGRHGETMLARLEIRDAALASAIEDRAVTLDRGGAAERRLRRKVVILSLAAVVSLIFTAIIGVPVLATRLTPLVPISVEQTRNAVDSQIRATPTPHPLALFQAPAKAARGIASRQAGRRLKTTATLPYLQRTWCGARISTRRIARRPTSTCSGLIDRAQAPRVSHRCLGIRSVAHRDHAHHVAARGCRSCHRMMLGDVGGGGVIAARPPLIYSRARSRRRHLYSVVLIRGRRDARSPPSLRGQKDEGIKSADHPDTKDRIVEINAVAPAGATTPLLGAADWAALKQICAPLPVSGTAPAGGTTAGGGQK